MALAKVWKVDLRELSPCSSSPHCGLGCRAPQGPFLLSLCFPLVPFPIAILSPYCFSFLLLASHPCLLSTISTPQSFHPQLGPELNLLLRPPMTNRPQLQWCLIRAASWHHMHLAKAPSSLWSLDAQPAHSCQKSPSPSPASPGSWQANTSVDRGCPEDYWRLTLFQTDSTFPPISTHCFNPQLLLPPFCFSGINLKI